MKLRDSARYLVPVPRRVGVILTLPFLYALPYNRVFMGSRFRAGHLEPEPLGLGVLLRNTPLCGNYFQKFFGFSLSQSSSTFQFLESKMEDPDYNLDNHEQEDGADLKNMWHSETGGLIDSDDEFDTEGDPFDPEGESMGGSLEEDDSDSF